MKKILAFGGWAVPPKIMRKFFRDVAGVDCVVDYIDINFVMPKLFDASGELSNDWAQIIIAENQLQQASGNFYDTIAGWSTGAMFAYAVAREFVGRSINHQQQNHQQYLQKLILLSATPCFCRKDDFTFGQKPSVLDQMIGGLKISKDMTLKFFYDRCGIDPDNIILPDYTVDQLTCGLKFLQRVDLRPLSLLPNINIKFYHGADDPIIPIAASKYFCEQIGGEHFAMKGGHAFFCG